MFSCCCNNHNNLLQTSVLKKTSQKWAAVWSCELHHYHNQRLYMLGLIAYSTSLIFFFGGLGQDFRPHTGNGCWPWLCSRHLISLPSQRTSKSEVNIRFRQTKMTSFSKTALHRRAGSGGTWWRTTLSLGDPIKKKFNYLKGKKEKISSSLNWNTKSIVYISSLHWLDLGFL